MKITKTIVLLLAITCLLSCFTGCSQKEVYDDYGYGLTENGLYENLDKYNITLPDFNKIELQYDEILQWYVDAQIEAGNQTIKTIDDYVYQYGNELLNYLGLAGKEVAELEDRVSVTLEFYKDGKKMEDFGSTGVYAVKDDGDNIMNSFLGHKKGDEYEVDYTFPEDDKDYPSQTVQVKVKINDVAMADPIASGVVEANLTKLQEELPNVTDVDTYLKALRPEIAKAILPDYMSNYVYEIKIDVPDEYTEYELYRLKFRINQIGYTYEEYCEEMKMTDEDIKAYCRQVAKENLIYMLVFKKLNYTITYEELKKYYGDNMAYTAQVQGEKYMRLNVLRDIALSEIIDMVQLPEDKSNHTNESDDSTPQQATNPS